MLAAYPASSKTTLVIQKETDKRLRTGNFDNCLRTYTTICPKMTVIMQWHINVKVSK